MFRSRAPRVIVLEALAVLLVVGAVVAAVAFRTRETHPPATNDRPLGGPQVDLSNVNLSQLEVSAVADPRHPRRFLAASIDRLHATRLYESSDAGRTWTTTPGPPAPARAACGADEPSVAIDGRGRRYVVLLATGFCGPARPQVAVAVQDRVGRWRGRAIAPDSRRFVDRAPWIAADATGRAYVVWTRLYETFATNAILTRAVLLLSRTDDGGRTWSKASAFAPRYRQPYVARVAVAPDGVVAVAIADAGARDLVLLRSRDGGRSFGAPTEISALREPPIPNCGAGSVLVPAQPQRCVGPAPTVLFAPGGDTVIVYAEPEHDGTQAVWSATVGRDGGLGVPKRVGRPDTTKADQFWPAAAFDRSDGLLWVCYYDTAGDVFRRKAWFTCTASKDRGETWSEPIRAADVPSDETEIAGDRRGYGDYEALLAVGGVAHPLWTDTRQLVRTNEEIFTSSIPARRLRWMP